jgi:hypothetical protein
MTQPPPPGDHDSPFARFAALVRRELGAQDVRLVEGTAPLGEAANVLYATLPDGARLAVTFAEQPDNREAAARRLEILVGTFAQTAHDDAPTRTRAVAAVSLHEELRALAQRAQAVDALVLDAHSPMVWGSATHRTPHEEPGMPAADLRLVGEVYAAPIALRPRAPSKPLDEPSRLVSREVPAVVPLSPPAASGVPPTPPESEYALRDDSKDPSALRWPAALSLEESANEPSADEQLGESSHRAIREVRQREEIPELRRGKVLHHHQRSDDFGYVAHSFAAIYVLVLVFEAAYDEIRAERALQDALPRIERLVLALPPLDPTPEPRGNVVSLRRARKR